MILMVTVFLLFNYTKPRSDDTWQSRLLKRSKKQTTSARRAEALPTTAKRHSCWVLPLCRLFAAPISTFRRVPTKTPRKGRDFFYGVASWLANGKMGRLQGWVPGRLFFASLVITVIADQPQQAADNDHSNLDTPGDAVAPFVNPEEDFRYGIEIIQSDSQKAEDDEQAAKAFHGASFCVVGETVGVADGNGICTAEMRGSCRKSSA